MKALKYIAAGLLLVSLGSCRATYEPASHWIDCHQIHFYENNCQCKMGLVEYLQLTSTYCHSGILSLAGLYVRNDAYCQTNRLEKLANGKPTHPVERKFQVDTTVSDHHPRQHLPLEP